MARLDNLIAENIDQGNQRKMIERLLQDFETARRAKEMVAGEKHALWRDYIGYFYGDEGTGGRPVQMVRPNIIRPACEVIASSTIGDRPVIHMWPQDDGDKLFSIMVDELQDFDWRLCGADHELRLASLDTLQVGTSFWKLFQDETTGRLTWTRVSPFSMFVDPHADAQLNAVSYLFEAEREPLTEIARRYPKFFKFEEGAPDVTGKWLSNTRTYQIGVPVPNTLPIPPGTFASVPIGYAERRDEKAYGPHAVVCQAFIREIGRWTFLMGSEARKHIRETWKSKSAFVTFVGDMIVDVMENPLPDDLHPYRVFRNVSRTDSWWGEGEVGPLITIQDAIEVNFSRMVEDVQRNTGGPYIYDTEHGEKYPRTLTWKKDAILGFKGGGNALQPLGTKDIQSGMIAITNMLLQQARDIPGAHPSLAGQRERGVIAAAAIRSLQSAAFGRMQPRKDEMRLTLEGCGRLYANVGRKVYGKKEAVETMGKMLGEAWEETRDNAQGGFDVQVEVGARVDQDPEAVLKFILEAANAGLFSDDGRIAIEQKMDILNAARAFYPGAMRNYLDLKTKKRAALRETAEKIMAERGKTDVPATAPVEPANYPPAQMAVA